jgi:hypothetical protein
MGVARTRLRPRRALGVRRMRELLASSTAAALLAILSAGAGCHSRQPVRTAADSAPVRLAKWKDGHRAAVSVTYDNGDLLSDGQRAVQDAILAAGVRVDFELVTGVISDAKLERMRWLEAHGLGFFGHGARHVNHDRLSPEEARRSARSCYETMQALGLKPVAFAYPTGHASRRSTRDAVREAGFLSARIFRASSRRDPYIVPGDEREPDDWYTLPTLVMMGRDSDPRDNAINDTEELRAYLDGAIARGAWLITTYHGINKPGAYGFYPLDGFVSDLHAITARDLWAGSLNDVTLYVRERASARLEHAWRREHGLPMLRLTLEDGLPDDRFDQPLTVLVRAPRAWRGRGVELRDPDGVVVGGSEAAGRAPIALSIRPDGRTYTARPAG